MSYILYLLMFQVSINSIQKHLSYLSENKTLTKTLTKLWTPSARPPDQRQFISRTFSLKNPAKNLLLQNLFKNLLPKIRCINVNQTSHKASLCKGNSSLIKWRATPLYQRKTITKCRKYIYVRCKNFLLQNHWATFNQTKYNAFFGEVDSSSLK